MSTDSTETDPDRDWTQSVAQALLNRDSKQMLPLIERATEILEAELKEVSDRIAVDPLRFQQIRDELARRRKAGDEQPPMDVVTIESQKRDETAFQENLVLKITAMEAEQARFVVEAELSRQQRVDAEERLALVVKHLQVKREPLSREAAQALADRFKTLDRLERLPHEWVVDAIIEASK